ncbi:hypothetical protein JCGZ_08996 [Jatropha curcas]|uniref:Uncharacterized protein n=1 Tax=Jatropha curcas TaxID=180498 RepID=A0A067KKM0_JATCU|nr:hypothetical protein JCGZ_08996 [Jatropha curcas]
MIQRRAHLSAARVASILVTQSLARPNRADQHARAINAYLSMARVAIILELRLQHTQPMLNDTLVLKIKFCLSRKRQPSLLYLPGPS